MKRKGRSEEGKVHAGESSCKKNTGACSRNLEKEKGKTRRSPMEGNKRGGGFEGMLICSLSISRAMRSHETILLRGLV